MQILHKFHVCHAAKNEKNNTYCIHLIDYCNQLSGSAKEISEHSFVAHLLTHILKEFAIMINIFEWQAPPPTSQHILDSIWLYKEKVTLVTEITDALSDAALYSQYRDYRGCGHGGSGRFGWQKKHGVPTARLATIPPQHAASRSAPRVEKTAALKETIQGEQWERMPPLRALGPYQTRLHSPQTSEGNTNRVCKGTASIATAKDCPLFWLPGHALTADTAAQMSWVIDFGASYYMCNNCNSFKSFKKTTLTYAHSSWWS